LDRRQHSDLLKFYSTTIPQPLINIVKSSNTAEQQMMMDKLTQEMALIETQTRVALATRGILAGLSTPVIQGANVAGAAADYANGRILPALEKYMKLIIDQYELEKEGARRVGQTILNREFQKRMEGLTLPAPGLKTPSPLRGGAVQSP
jgi:hypothetical protein